MLLNKIGNVQDKLPVLMQKIKDSGFPVVVYGVGMLATVSTEILNENGVKVDAYFVDKEYLKPDIRFLSVPVYSIEDLDKRYEHYNLCIAVIMITPECVARLKKATQHIGGECFQFDQNRLFKTTYSYFSEHADELEESYHLMADEQSREIFVDYINALVSNNYSVDNKFTPDRYFNELTKKADADGIFIDCGAYNGDTIKDYIKFTNNRYKKIYAFEPDKRIYGELCKNVQGNAKITCYPKGCWDVNEEVSFDNSTWMGLAAIKESDMGTMIETVSLDSVIPVEDSVSLIKMDIEGSELPALKGAENIIMRNMPYLAISVYHRPDDLLRIPQYIVSLSNVDKEYRLYLRHHCSIWDLIVLYAVPVQKNLISTQIGV